MEGEVAMNFDGFFLDEHGLYVNFVICTSDVMVERNGRKCGGIGQI
jgi:hypothetical protein